jgi:son of sevenless-like protein
LFYIMPRHVQVDTSPLVKLSTLPDVIAAQKSPTEAMGTEVEEPHDSFATRDVVVFSVLCMYDFDSDEAGLLSFKKNEILDVVKRDESGWWAAMRQDEQGAPVVGWISRAYVSVLSEEMEEKLWNIEKQFRIPEYEAEMLYNSALVNDSIIIDDTPSPSPSPLDDGSSQVGRE